MQAYLSSTNLILSDQLFPNYLATIRRHNSTTLLVVTNMDEEAAEVEVLQAKLAKTADLTNKISLSLQKLSTSTTNVEQAVEPIYAKTQKLTTLSASMW